MPDEQNTFEILFYSPHEGADWYTWPFPDEKVTADTLEQARSNHDASSKTAHFALPFEKCVPPYDETPGFSLFVRLHALCFAGGFEWDCINGWRPHSQTLYSESSEVMGRARVHALQSVDFLDENGNFARVSGRPTVEVRFTFDDGARMRLKRDEFLKIPRDFSFRLKPIYDV